MYTINTIDDVLKHVNKAPKAIYFSIRKHKQNKQKKKQDKKLMNKTTVRPRTLK